MKLKLTKSLNYYNGTEDITINELDLNFSKLVGQDIFDVEKEMIMMGHPIGTQFIQSPRALATLGIKAAGLPSYLSETLAAQDTMKLISITGGFLMGVPTKSELLA